MNTTHAAVTSSLKQEVKATFELLDILQEEQNQLLATSIDTLESLVSKKAGVVTQLTQHTWNRHDNLEKAGYKPNLAGMNAWLENSKDHPDAIKIKETWNQLVSLTQSAKELNRVNGMLIASHMVRNQQALSILHGSQESTDTYGPDGQPSRATATPVRSVVTG